MENGERASAYAYTMLVTPNHQPSAVDNQSYDQPPVIGSSSDEQVDKECQMYFGRRLDQIYNSGCPRVNLDDPKDIRRREIEYEDSSLSELIIRADNAPKHSSLDEEDLEYEVAEAEDNEGEGEPNAPPSVFDLQVDLDEIVHDILETSLGSSVADSENDDNVDDLGNDEIEIILSESDSGEWTENDISDHLNGVYPAHSVSSVDDEVEVEELEDEQSSNDSEDLIIISNDYPQSPQQTL